MSLNKPNRSGILVASRRPAESCGVMVGQWTWPYFHSGFCRSEECNNLLTLMRLYGFMRCKLTISLSVLGSRLTPSLCTKMAFEHFSNQ